MFDNIRCEYKLPGAVMEIQNALFQTKNFERMSDTYTITEGGEFIHHVHEYESVPEEERPHYGTPEWEEKSLYRWVGSIKSKFVEDVKVNHSGLVNIYTIIHDSEWWEYEIKFIDGKVINVKRINKDL